MVGSRVEVLPYPPGDGLGVAHRHDGFREPVRAADDPLVRSEQFAGVCRLPGGDQVRVRAVGVRAGQLDHLGAERGEQLRGALRTGFDPVRDGRHLVQVLPHGGQRLGVRAVGVVHERGMADPEPEHEPPGEPRVTPAAALRTSAGAG